MNKRLHVSLFITLVLVLGTECRAQSEPFQFNPGNNVQSWSLNISKGATNLPGLVRVLQLEVTVGSLNQIASGSIEATNTASIDILTVKVTHNPGSSPQPAFFLGISNEAGNPSADLRTVRWVSRTGSSSNGDLILGINGAQRIGGENAGDLGFLFADSFANIQTSGDIEADITTDNGTAGGGSGFVMNQIASIQCGGLFRGSLSVPQNDDTGDGQIFSITSSTAVGESGDLASIWAATVIHEIKAPVIWADVLSGESTANHNGNIRIINATAAGGASGDLNGTVLANKFTQQLSSDKVSIQGDLNADISLLNSVLIPVEISGDLNGDFVIGTEIKDNTGSGDKDGRVSIGGDLNGDLTIGTRVLDTDSSDPNGLAGIAIDGKVNGTITIGDELDSQIAIRNDQNSGDPGALLGQIIVNASNAGKQWLKNIVLGTGAGTITVGPNESQPDDAPSYDRASADIGGGAIGLVPFNLHGADSNPAVGAIVLNTHFLTQVRIRHYGPITIDQTGGQSGVLAVKIERRTSYYPGNNNSNNNPWSDVSSRWSLSDISVSGRDLLVAGDPTEEPVPDQFICGYEYRITPIAARVSCDIASPVDVTAWTYQFEIPYCPWP